MFKLNSNLFSFLNIFSGEFFGSSAPVRFRPFLTLKDRPRAADPLILRANNLNIGSALKQVIRTRAPLQLDNEQLANQVLADGAAGQQQANQLAGVALDNAVDVDDPDFITIANGFGSGGECRHNLHCKGNERCVRRNGRYICTKRHCNVDSDCRDSRLCRDQKCRRCRRCRDDIQAPNPK